MLGLMFELSSPPPTPRQGEAHSCALLPGEVVNTHGPVEPDKDNIRQEPYTLPQGFTWDALDLGDRGVVSRPGQAALWIGRHFQ